MISKRILLLNCSVLLLVPAFCLIGCIRQYRPPGLPKLYPCQVTLTQEGKPVEGATVLLSAKEEGSCPWTVSGITNEQGTASLVTYGQFAGAPEGTFLILLDKRELVGEPGYFDETNLRYIQKPVKVYTLVDEKFTKRDKTPLEIKIERKNTTKADFELGPAVRIHIDTIISGS